MQKVIPRINRMIFNISIGLTPSLIGYSIIAYFDENLLSDIASNDCPHFSHL